jgi:hypothetical protein
VFQDVSSHLGRIVLEDIEDISYNRGSRRGKAALHAVQVFVKYFPHNSAYITGIYVSLFLQMEMKYIV